MNEEKKALLAKCGAGGGEKGDCGSEISFHLK
jgi:hypothetical protein